MSPARPPEGARTAACTGEGHQVRPARPPEGARNGDWQGEGSPWRRSTLRTLSMGLLALLTGLAQAHKSSDAYLQLSVDGAVVTQRLDIPLRDLDRDLNLDADEDGALSWGEVRTRWAAIEQLADAAVQVRADGQACSPGAVQPPQLDEHTDGRYAVLKRELVCAAPVRSLAVVYGLFAASDPTHRGLLKLAAAPDRVERSAVLVPGAGAQRFALDTDEPGGAGSESARDAARRGFLGFVWEGLHHIAIGLDHILFLVTLLMVAVWRRDGAAWVPRASAASAWREALTLVTAFTVAHSLTLGLAAAGVLAPPSRWVESLIALSVLAAAVDNLRPFLRGPRWAMVAVFGLVHGFGFAGPLQDLGLRAGHLAVPLLGFNLGVELGQLALVAVLLPLACGWRARAFYRRGVVGVGSAAIGLLALGWTIERSLQIQLLP